MRRSVTTADVDFATAVLDGRVDRIQFDKHYHGSLSMLTRAVLRKPEIWHDFGAVEKLHAYFAALIASLLAQHPDRPVRRRELVKLLRDNFQYREGAVRVVDEALDSMFVPPPLARLADVVNARRL